MQKFVVIELNDEASCIDLLSYCVKRNFERVSLLSRLEDHPYLRDDTELIQEDGETQESESMVVQLSEEERQRLMKIITTPGQQTLSLERIHPSQEQHLIAHNQLPSTSSYASNQMFYIKRDDNSTFKDDAQSGMSQFDVTVNSVAHGQAGMSSMFACDGSPNGSDNLRRKTPASRKAEDSIKATCKECGHDVMYSPQRTWNLMRHVWIMHESSKPYRCSLCDYSHIKPYVRKHIDNVHKHQNADILDNNPAKYEAEWADLLHRCFGVTYRKWKHHKEDTHHTVFAAAEDDYSREHHFSPEEDVMVTL